VPKPSVTATDHAASIAGRTSSRGEAQRADASEHYFESSFHRESVIRCIGDGILPLKFAYTGSAAHTHDRLARSEGYQSVIGLVSHEVDVLLADGFPVEALTRVVEIGPGNGMHTVAFLRLLGSRSYRCSAYLGLDFSATLLGMVRSNIREAFGTSVSVSTDIWDIEAGPSDRVEQWRSAREATAPLLVCLLGHTLGNLESGIQALVHIFDSLRPGDVLLAGLTLRNPTVDEWTVLAPYRTEVFHDAALEPLRAAGVDPEDIDFTVRFTDGAVVGEATILRTVRAGNAMFPAGHALRCFISRRFVMEDLSPLFQGANWTIRTTSLDDRCEHAVVTAVRGPS
jgi:L-histidine Nalpha-methyltransferase